MKENQSILHVRIKHARSKDPINPLFSALTASKSLQELTVECFGKEIVAVLGSHLEFSTIQTLNIEGYDVDALDSWSFFEGLQINSSLNCITLRRTSLPYLDIQKLNSCLNSIVSALYKNITVSEVIVKTVPNNFAMASPEVKKDCGVSLTDILLTVAQSSHLAIFIERNSGHRKENFKKSLLRTPRQSVDDVDVPEWVKTVYEKNDSDFEISAQGVHSEQVTEYLQNKNYEELRQYIENHSTQSILHDLYPNDLDLGAKTFADSLSIRIVQEKLDENRKRTTKLREEKTELEEAYNQTNSELEELQLRLAILVEKSDELSGSIKKVSQELDERTAAQENLEVNLMLFQLSREKNEPELKKWQEKLQTDLNEWTCDDISFLLKEIGLGKSSKIFFDNSIDGVVIQGLDTNDLTSTLGLTFKEAKKLQMYLLLLQHRCDIYSIPTVVLNWSNNAVCNWLVEKKFQNLSELFVQENITGAELVFLEKADLTTKFKIQALGMVVRLQNEIAKLKESVIAELVKKE